jgi:hypothetical protein
MLNESDVAEAPELPWSNTIRQFLSSVTTATCPTVSIWRANQKCCFDWCFDAQAQAFGDSPQALD